MNGYTINCSTLVFEYFDFTFVQLDEVWNRYLGCQMSSFVGVMFALALVDSVEKRGGNGKG